ncbi:hypothetical protein [Sphingomonas oligoaromativorans]|uniref:hypothetical protein n=1 Tax=Sphingomonas oligoaromativorans TaxID=575322 RepID=UPI0014240906|nr:hypothetical protein [Sphingomonas oligoaromativorans]NIJ34337.1 hypothetical protein [Sphingomonas oligoaromativorans]
MSRTSIIQTSFNGGELSPRMAGRPDQSVYGSGCRQLNGWLPTLQGPAVAAPGTRYVARAKGPFRLLPFEYNITQGYQIEASDHAFRFYTNNVRLEDGTGTPIEIATPWTYAQVLQLDYEQSADVLYLAHGEVPMQELDRTGATTFSIAPFAFKNGPYEDDNSDDTILVTIDQTTGTATVTATKPIFQPGDVGGFFRIQARDFSNVSAWEAGMAGIPTGSRMRSNGKVYECVGGTDRTGTIPPAHSEGTAWDGSNSGTDINGKGPYGKQWLYLYGPFGQGTITAYVSPTVVKIAVVTRLADSLITVGSSRWAFGAFSPRRGYPNAVVLWNQRLVLAKGAKAYGSVVGGYNDFARYDSSGNAQRDLGFTITLPNPNVIRWLAADRKLLIGTARAEHVAEQLLTNSDTAGPPTIQVETQSTYGSAPTKALLAAGRVLAVQRAGRKLLELGYSVAQDRYEASDLTRLAEHIGMSGFVELAWQQEPEGLIWAVRRDGSLAAMTYSPGQQVIGWARRTLGGGMLARTASVITDPAGERDQLWIGAERGGTWWVLRQESIWQSGDDASRVLMVDAGLTYDGPPVASGSGAAHLAGETVSVLADGLPHPDITIGAGGQWTINFPASVVSLGFPFPALLQTLPIEAGGDVGTAQGRIKRISRVTLRLLEAQGIRISVQGGQAIADEHRVPDDPMDEAVPLFSGDVAIETVGSFDRYGMVTIERFQPTPATLLAVMPTVTTSER